MTKSIRAELFKLVRRRGSWLASAGLAALPLLLGLILRLTPATGPEGQAAAPGTGVDGYTVILLTVSTAMLFFAPLVAAFIGAELLAKEAGEGTLKLSLLRPVSRAQVLGGKCVACLTHNVALVAALWLVALAAGGLFFHYGSPRAVLAANVSITGPGGDVSSVGEVSLSGAMGQGEALLRLAASYGYLAISLTVVGLLALSWSTVIRNAAGVVVATLGVVLGMRALEGVPGLGRYLLSAQLVSQSLLRRPTDWAGLATSLGVLVAYAAAFVAAGALVLSRRDVSG